MNSHPLDSYRELGLLLQAFSDRHVGLWEVRQFMSCSPEESMGKMNLDEWGKTGDYLEVVHIMEYSRVYAMIKEPQLISLFTREEPASEMREMTDRDATEKLIRQKHFWSGPPEAGQPGYYLRITADGKEALAELLAHISSLTEPSSSP